MDILRALPLKQLKKLPVGLQAGENLVAGPVYAGQDRPWGVAPAQWRGTWRSVVVACNSYGQALSWRLPLPLNSATDDGQCTLTVRASGWNPGSAAQVNVYSGAHPLAQPWICPPGLLQQIEITWSRANLGHAFPTWGRPVLLVFQAEKLTGVPRDWQMEVDDSELYRESGFFGSSQPNPSNVIRSGADGDLWETKAGVYLDGRDALVDAHFIDFAYASSEVDHLPALDKTPLLTHPPMLYPQRLVTFSSSGSGLAINAGGVIQAN